MAQAPKPSSAGKSAAAPVSAAKPSAGAAKPAAAPTPAAKPAPAAAAKAAPVERSKLIAETAYFLAQKRGFTGGSPEADWLAAEKQVDALLRKRP